MREYRAIHLARLCQEQSYKVALKPMMIQRTEKHHKVIYLYTCMYTNCMSPEQQTQPSVHSHLLKPLSATAWADELLDLLHACPVPGPRCRLAVPPRTLGPRWRHKGSEQSLKSWARTRSQNDGIVPILRRSLTDWGPCCAVWLKKKKKTLAGKTIFFPL